MACAPAPASQGSGTQPETGIAVAPLIPGSLPSRVMLDEEGYITPVKNQNPRGACQSFATVGAIESEYLRQYGLTLDLSEEYLINMFNETRAPNWSGGDLATPMLVASYTALPPEASWPYISNESTVTTAVDQAVGIAPGSAAATAFYNSEYVGPTFSLLNNEIGNYNNLVYPGPSAHAAAQYGPTPGGFTTVARTPNNPNDPTPLETILAAGHPIVIGTTTAAWQQNPDGSFGDNGTALTNDHDIVVVGYDTVKGTFRIKNSWGSGWNGNGFADFSFALVMRTMGTPVYVTSIRSPYSPPTIGTAAVRGFWSAVINGVPGIAVIHHAVPAGVAGWPAVTPEAGDFHGADGTVLSLNWVSGNYNTATFTVGGSTSVAQTITISGGPNQWSYSATRIDGTAVESGTWCRTSSSTLPANLSPGGYASTLTDPYLFPSGSCTPNGSSQGALTVAVASSGWAYLAQRGADNSLSVYSAFESGPWTSQLVAGADTTFSRPAIFVRDTGEVDVVAQGPKNSLVYYYNMETTFSQWVPLTVAPAGSAFSDPSLFVRSSTGNPANEADVVVQGPSGTLLYFWNSQGGPWNPIPIASAGSTVGAPALFVRPNGEADIVAQGQNNSLFEYSAAYPGAPWVFATVAGSGTTFSSPSLYVRRPTDNPANEADVVAQGPNSSLFYYYNGQTGGSWTPLTIAGAGTTFGVPALAVGAGNVFALTAEGPNSSLYYYSAATGLPWSSLELGGPGTAFSSPSVFFRSANPADEVDIAVQGAIGKGTYFHSGLFSGWQGPSGI